MDAVLIILGVLGIGAIVISAFVFTAAARNYVSADERDQRPKPATHSAQKIVQRRPTDRRSDDTQVKFPVTVNGVLVMDDRRKLPERRIAA